MTTVIPPVLEMLLATEWRAVLFGDNAKKSHHGSDCMSFSFCAPYTYEQQGEIQACTHCRLQEVQKTEEFPNGNVQILTFPFPSKKNVLSASCHQLFISTLHSEA
mmetsp:Transcript_43693/g.81299  ORF Transcript_43693/g.81299 Transcript_43693/m.81299 type:complete len:105 (-) Transcript_43693:400-714(-)